MPHSAQPLDSYHESFWTCCFPCLFRYGIAGLGRRRRTRILDSDLIHLLLQRVDGHPDGLWCLDLDFISVAYSTLHRRELLKKLRVKVKTGAISKRLQTLLRVATPDFEEVAAIVGEKQGISMAMTDPKVDPLIKDLLKLMHLTQMTVPQTDGARVKMRYRMRALQIWFGFPLIFFTLNPADVKHPFTFYYSTEGFFDKRLDLELPDADLTHVLQNINLGRIVAKDPVAAVKAFHQHLRLFFDLLLGCTWDPQKLHCDGIAAKGTPSLLSHILATFAVQEPQLRGSLHLHLLLHVCGFFSPQQAVPDSKTTCPCW